MSQYIYRNIHDNNIQLVPPRYTTDERVGLTTETGSLIYNTTEGKILCYNGTSWNDLNS